eukprot:scaffold651915_cov38-Prasinocladus_malaysianus.AAC.1
MLCHLDDPVSLARRYVQHIAQPGDILAIAETPLAIMQVRPLRILLTSGIMPSTTQLAGPAAPCRASL